MTRYAGSAQERRRRAIRELTAPARAALAAAQLAAAVARSPDGDGGELCGYVGPELTWCSLPKRHKPPHDCGSGAPME